MKRLFVTKGEEYLLYKATAPVSMENRKRVIEWATRVRREQTELELVLKGHVVIRFDKDRGGMMFVAKEHAAEHDGAAAEPK